MLKHRELAPGIEGNDRLQHRWQITDLLEHASPFFETLVLVPIKIVDQAGPFPGGFDGAGLTSMTASDRASSASMAASSASNGLGPCSDASSPSPASTAAGIRRRPDTSPGPVGPKGCCRRRLPSVRRPSGLSAQPGRLRCDAPAAAQHVAGDGEFVGRGADVVAGGVQHQVLEVDEFAIDPQRGAGVGEVDPSIRPSRTGERATRSSYQRRCQRALRRHCDRIHERLTI